MSLKSYTFIFLSSHGSSLIGLPFPPSFVVYCFCSCDVRSDLVYIDMCSDLVFGDVCSILLSTMRLEIFCSLSQLDVMAVCHFSFLVERRGG